LISTVVDRRYSVLCLLTQVYIGNLHLFVHCFAHVVDGEQCDGDAGERFHLHSGLRNSACCASYFRAIVCRDNIDLDLAQRQSVAERNELGSLFGALNACDARGRKDVALRDLIICDQVERFALKPDFPRRNRRPRTERFGRDIDHLRSAIRANVREALHDSAADCDHFAARLVIVAKIVLLRLSIDHVEKELLEFVIACAGTKGLHDVEFEVAAETRT